MAPRSIYTVTVDGATDPSYVGGSKLQATKVLLAEQMSHPAGTVHLSIVPRNGAGPSRSDIATQGRAIRKLISQAMKEPTTETADLIEGSVGTFTNLVRERAKANA